MIKIILSVAAFLLVYFGVEIFRRWTLRRSFFDIPNERSSHTEPTPRGGGLIIDLVCLALFLIYCLIFRVDIFWFYFAGALIVALISWLDDVFSISVVWRFLCHSLAAILAIWGLGFWEQIYIPFAGVVHLGQAGQIVTFFWIVWLINAYNFMDGIDGIAGAQALTAGVGWLVAGMLLGAENTASYGGLIAIASLAFLIHNWQPAKIFMGDVGSAFLGYTFAVLPLMALKESPPQARLFPLVGITLLSLFVFDGMITLLKRIARMEKVWHAHREHIYQKLVISGFSHRVVTGIYAVLSIFTLLLLIFWLRSESSFKDFVFVIVVFQLICLFIYSYVRKH